MSSMFTVMIVFFFNDTATTEIYTLSLHDALPISQHLVAVQGDPLRGHLPAVHLQLADEREVREAEQFGEHPGRSEEHTSELQSRQYLVCRLLLEKKKKSFTTHSTDLFLPYTDLHR